MSITKPSPLNKVFLRRLMIAATIIVLLPLAWLGPLDNAARDYVESGLKRALVTFAAARTANAVISVLQATTVAISPLGIGITAAPGQILDPLNDLLEEFSALMLAACVSLGVQRVLISIGGFPAVSAALTVALLAWSWFAFRAALSPRWLVRLLVMLLFVRFAVPIASLGSEMTFRAVMANQYAEAQSQVDLTSQQMRTLGPGTDVAPPEGLVERWTRWYTEKKGDLKSDLNALKDKAENAVRHIITLMALFIVQTVLLPLLFLWLAYKFFGATLNWRSFTSPRRPPSGTG
jgi:hypothetical protein